VEKVAPVTLICAGGDPYIDCATKCRPPTASCCFPQLLQASRRCQLPAARDTRRLSWPFRGLVDVTCCFGRATSSSTIRSPRVTPLPRSAIDHCPIPLTHGVHNPCHQRSPEDLDDGTAPCAEGAVAGLRGGLLERIVELLNARPHHAPHFVMSCVTESPIPIVHAPLFFSV
jgi:hypothetical protein